MARYKVTGHLAQNTHATQIHGITGQDIVDTTLSAGAAYTYEGVAKTGIFGERYASILIDGYRYRVRAEFVDAS